MKPHYFLFVFVLSIIVFKDGIPQQLPEVTSKVLVRFNEPMSRDGIFDVSNYKVIDQDNNELKVYKVGVVEGDTAVVLFTESHLKNKTYRVIVYNLKDKAGNIISQENNYAQYQKPD